MSTWLPCQDGSIPTPAFKASIVAARPENAGASRPLQRRSRPPNADARRRPGALVADVRSADRAQRHLRRRGDRRHPHQGTSLRSRRKRGAFAQAIGRSRGGRTTKVHGWVDDRGRPRVLLLSAGNINDISMAEALIQAAGPIRLLLADKGYDADHLRRRRPSHPIRNRVDSIANRSRRRDMEPLMALACRYSLGTASETKSERLWSGRSTFSNSSRSQSASALADRLGESSWPIRPAMSLFS